MKRNQNIEVVQDEEKPVAAKVMADSIVKIGNAMKELSKTRLKEDTIIMLVAKKTRMHQFQVKSVLDALQNLEKDWLK